MIRADGVESTGSVLVDPKTLTPEVALALVRLFRGCGRLTARMDVDPPYMHWRWGSSRNMREWRSRADRLRQDLESWERLRSG